MNEEHRIKAAIQDDSSPIRAGITSDANPASETSKGIIRIATEEEALAGELDNVAITPHTLDSVNSTNNAIINARIESLESSEDSEMEDIINIIQQRTINMIQFND